MNWPLASLGSRRRFVVALIFSAFFCSVVERSLSAADASPMNVLMIVSDDLNNRLGLYGDAISKTPNLDRLGSLGVVFERAYCQFPHCNPSRASFLSGLRPNTTKVTNNNDSLYKNIPDIVTLPHWFRRHGYETIRAGKIFHLGVPTGTESMDDPKAWDFGMPFKDERPYPAKRPSAVTVENAKQQGISWIEATGTDDDLIDGQIAATAIQRLKSRDAKKPFFLAVGFHRPHLPLVAPAKYFDLYPFDSVHLPKEPEDDEADIPLPARNGAVPGYTIHASADQRRAAIRAYLATISYMDAQVGRLLQTLQELNVADNTIVLFLSDHGWHLGEHHLWHKRSLFEESARVPLIVYVPKAKGNGRKSVGLVELLDLFPTLCDLTGVPAPQNLQGKSLRPLLDDPATSLHEAAFTEARRGKKAEYWGRSVRTSRWRYTEWNQGQDGVELYDHSNDPGEFTNLATDPRHAETIQQLKRLLADKTFNN